MTLKAFTSNYKDDSKDSGFQFVFYCDHCKDGFKSSFIESKSFKKQKTTRGIGEAIRIGSSLLGGSKGRRVGWEVARGARTVADRHRGMPPEWHKEHEEAFELAQNEVKGYFHRCPKCAKWVCETDWNEQGGLCVKCAPRVNVEVASARADKMVSDIKSKATETEVFTGEIEEKQTVCHQCGKPAGQGKFCVNCGTNLEMFECDRCGTKSPMGTRFCGECGNRLE